TLRRHLAAHHRASYHKWCDKNKFESKLEDDIKARAAATSQKQTNLDGHVRTTTRKEDEVTYSESAFRSAAVKWLIATDQPIAAFEHPAFITMINIASRAKGAVTLPKRAATRREIIDMFHKYMRDLKTRFSVSKTTYICTVQCFKYLTSLLPRARVFAVASA
ncbi:uncharacterized protein C8Q71DRAFT_715451, partial [Rhodofomes roseus]